jgi:hypothetical protein
MKRDKKMDLKDSKEDEKKMEPEEASLDLPDVREIPGQEHVRPPQMGEYIDTTISSDDEEGVGVFDDEEIIDPSKDTDNVSREEQASLDDASKKVMTKYQQALDDIKLDNRDAEGEPLNEKTNLSGSDLDVPGSELDDESEDVGAEDEENNPYSLDDDQDQNNNP